MIGGQENSQTISQFFTVQPTCKIFLFIDEFGG